MKTVRLQLVSLRRQEEAGVAVQFALVVVPLILLMLMCVEFARYTLAEMRLKSACELALRAAVMGDDGQGQRFANSNMLDGGRVNSQRLQFSISSAGSEKRLKLEAEMPGSLLALMGRDRLLVRASCGVRSSQNDQDQGVCRGSHHLSWRECQQEADDKTKKTKS